MKPRSALVALCVLLTALGVVRIVFRPDEVSVRAGDISVQLPPAGWYVMADTPATGIEPDEALRATAEEWAAIATQRGYEDVRVFPQPQAGGTCSTGPDDGTGMVEAGCSLASPAFGYVVVLRGPLSPPPSTDLDATFDWYTRTRGEVQQEATSRALPFEAGLSLLSFPSRDGPPLPSVPHVDAAALPNGWYRAVTPGSITTDDAIALTAARAMAFAARKAGYEDVRIGRWPAGPGPCDPWGCEDSEPEIVYVVVLDGPYPAPELAEAAADHPAMVATPHVVRLEFAG